MDADDEWEREPSPRHAESHAESSPLLVAGSVGEERRRRGQLLLYVH